MSSAVGRRRDSLTPALLAALALHVGLFLALTIFRPPLPLPLGSAVPINIVSEATTTDSRPADQAPLAQTAQVEQPVPQAKAPQPPPSPPQPAPSPPVKVAAPTPRPVPKPTPTPTVKAVQPPRPLTKSTPPPPAKATPAPRKDTFDLNALAASIARAQKSSPPRPASGLRGPTRAETAPVARVDAGQGVSQSDIDGLGQLLNRLWLKNCDSGTIVNVTVRLAVNNDGRVLLADAGGRERSGDPATAASAIRAIAAVHQAAPYAEEFRGRAFSVNFDAAKACANR